MIPNIQKPEKKNFFVANYRQLWQLEEAIGTLRKKPFDTFQLSVMEKLGTDCVSVDGKILPCVNGLKVYWKDSLGKDADYRLFRNPEMGTLFIAGVLTRQFLHNLDGKVLGSISSGPYGILRGLGLTEHSTKRYLKLLDEGQLLLFVRGFKNCFDELAAMLNAVN